MALPTMAYADDGEDRASELEELATAVSSALASGVLSGDQPRSGTGHFDRVELGEEFAEPTSEGRLVNVAIDVEEGLRIDPERFGSFVMTTLRDERGWEDLDGVRFVSTGMEPDVTIHLASPDTVDLLCAPLDTGGYTSCRVDDAVVLNVDRWVGATEDFRAAAGTLTEYRHYVVNHEVGHALGHGHEEVCLPGGQAPVMMQQTLDLRGCTPNGWPAPK